MKKLLEYLLKSKNRNVWVAAYSRTGQQRTRTAPPKSCERRIQHPQNPEDLNAEWVQM